MRFVSRGVSAPLSRAIARVAPIPSRRIDAIARESRRDATRRSRAPSSPPSRVAVSRVGARIAVRSPRAIDTEFRRARTTMHLVLCVRKAPDLRTRRASSDPGWRHIALD
jgi:hypothetical protein